MPEISLDKYTASLLYFKETLDCKLKLYGPNNNPSYLQCSTLLWIIADFEAGPNYVLLRSGHLRSVDRRLLLTGVIIELDKRINLTVERRQIGVGLDLSDYR